MRCGRDAMAEAEPSKRAYRAVLFDLYTALLDSWSLWNRVAGSDAAGRAWRMRYLQHTYETGAYRPYEDLVLESAQKAGVPRERAEELLRRWSELTPWPEAPRVVAALSERVPVGVATNSSAALAKIAVATLGVPLRALVTAEEAGYYKPHPGPYRMALDRVGVAAEEVLFVAGSPSDLPGAAAVGMPVFWHNRIGLPAPDHGAKPIWISDSLLPLLSLV
jgi:2-haloacid dehalogenase